MLIAFVAFLFLYPYSKKIKKFKAEDLNWEIINKTNQFKEFDPSRLIFKKTYYFSDEIQKLDQTVISIKGFLKKEKHGSHTDLILTETVTDVCFMCNHDESYMFIELIPGEKESPLYGISDDAYVEVKGTFLINKENYHLPPYSMEDAILINTIHL